MHILKIRELSAIIDNVRNQDNIIKKVYNIHIEIRDSLHIHTTIAFSYCVISQRDLSRREKESE